MARFDGQLFEQLNSLVVPYAAWSSGCTRIQMTIANASHFHDRCLLPILGPSRSGKTRLVEVATGCSPNANPKDADGATVRYVRLPRSPRPKAVLMQLQYALGYPLFYVGSEEAMQIRVTQLIERLGVQTIVFDDMQHCVSSQGVINYLVADLFKTLLDEAGVTLIGAGLEDAATVLEANEQLTGRCLNAISLDRFDWNDEKSRAEFVRVVDGFRNGLPSLRLPEDSDDPQLAFKWFVGSGGLTGYIHKILRITLEHAKRDNRLTVGLRELDEAHAAAVYYRSGEMHPFSRSYKPDEVAGALELAASIGERKLPELASPVRGKRSWA